MKIQYVSIGKNGAGPIIENPAATNMVPKTVMTLGGQYLSHSTPNPGAVMA